MATIPGYRSLDYVSSVDLWSDKIAMEIAIFTHLSLVISSYSFEKELITSGGYVEMALPWQFCRTIGLLLSQRFPLSSAKAQPKGGFTLKSDTYLMKL